MGKASNDKGKRGERELAQFLRAHGYGGAKRGQQYCGADGSADVVGLPGVHIECKRVERLNLHDAMGQAKADARGGDIPAVFHKKNRGEWLVTMRAEDMLTMHREWGAGRAEDSMIDNKDV